MSNDILLNKGIFGHIIKSVRSLTRPECTYTYYVPNLKSDKV